MALVAIMAPWITYNIWSHTLTSFSCTTRFATAINKALSVSYWLWEDCLMDANFSVRIDLGYGMNWFLEKVEFSSPCLVPSLYCSVYDLKCVTMHKISRGSPRPLLTRGINMVTLSPISIGRKIWLVLDIILSACFDKLLPLAIHSLWM